MKDSIQALRRLSAHAILDRARNVLGSVVHPLEQKYSPLSELPFDALQPEIDVDETLDHTPLLTKIPIDEKDLWMSYSSRRKHPLVLTVDTSLSMTGEKLALTAVALAVVLLEFPDDPIGIVAFENEARILKYVDKKISLQQLIERFLDIPAQGYTHLEDGMRSALKLVRSIHLHRSTRPASVLLLTDGKYTAGKDPTYLAPRFPHLIVLKIGHEKASLDLCKELAQKGRGALLEVPDLESLPGVMYGAVKDLIRGGSR